MRGILRPYQWNCRIVQFVTPQVKCAENPA